MFCSTCGSNIGNETNYCPVCGAKIAAPLPMEDSAFTEQKNTEIPEGDSAFGPDADRIIAEQQASQQPQPVQSEYTQPQPVQTEYTQPQQPQPTQVYQQPEPQSTQSYTQPTQQGYVQQPQQQPQAHSQYNQVQQPRPQQSHGPQNPQHNHEENKKPSGKKDNNGSKIAIIVGIAAAVLVALIVGAVVIKKFRGRTTDVENGKDIEASTNENGDYVDEDGNVIPEPDTTEDKTDEAKADDKDFTPEDVEYMARPSIIDDYMVVTFEPITPKVPEQTLSADFSDVDNADFVEYYPQEAKDLLAANQFVVMSSYSNEFWPDYEDYRYEYIPSFITVDSIMHTYHLYFAHVMKNTEKTYLIKDVNELSRLMKEKSQDQYNTLKGTEWEKAAWTNLAFFTVGNVLSDPNAEIPAEVADVVKQELDLIESADKIVASPIFNDPENMEDYTQYIPRGYYDTEEELQKYFKTMMWYGRRNFARKNEDQDRAALLMTLAMDKDTLPLWEEIYTITAFFAGASDDSGYYEYRPIIDKVYGTDVTVDKLPGDTENWAAFHELTGQLPAPKINSVVVLDEDTAEEKEAKINGFRFMGQRFSIDEAIFQNLCYDKTGEKSDGSTRMLPNALDVPAALGSDVALDILKSKGETDYAGYTDNMSDLRAMVEKAPDSTWNSSLYSQWLHTLRPTLEERGEGYPSFMQTVEWRKKNLTSFLGSYTELKHDTILYSKQMMAEMGGGEIPVRDDRGYVEPEVEVYARLLGLVNATSKGLAHYNALTDADKENLDKLADIVSNLQKISEKELTGVVPTDEEFEFIRSYGGQIEHFWQEVNKDSADSEYFTVDEFPAAIVADVATDPNGSCLELGTGHVNTIIVLVEVDGVKKFAWGKVYSFYQFEQPISERLTDKKWRQMLGIEMQDDGSYSPDPDKVPKEEDWTKSYRYDQNE